MKTLEEKNYFWGEYIYPRYPALDRMVYIDDLKANLLTITQFGDNNFIINSSYDMCEVINKEREIIIIRKRTMNDL